MALLRKPFSTRVSTLMGTTTVLLVRVARVARCTCSRWVTLSARSTFRSRNFFVQASYDSFAEVHGDGNRYLDVTELSDLGLEGSDNENVFIGYGSDAFVYGSNNRNVDVEGESSHNYLVGTLADGVLLVGGRDNVVYRYRTSGSPTRGAYVTHVPIGLPPGG
eukprot:scaffold7211_cov470-Prasinococcus_capsulatus_cf.AAC.1